MLVLTADQSSRQLEFTPSVRSSRCGWSPLSAQRVAKYKGRAGSQGSQRSERSYWIRHRTLGIVGYGDVGSEISVLAERLGMKVCFCDTAA